MRASASKSSLILSGCTAWLHPEAILDDSVGPSAEHGKRVHSLIERELGEPVDTVDEDYAMPAVNILAQLTTSDPYCGDLLSEPAYGYNVMTGETFTGVGRDSYPEGDDWFCGTADVVWKLPDYTLVLDWKTGNPWKCEDQLKTLAGLVSLVTKQPGNYRMVSVKVDYQQSFAALDFTMSKLEVDLHLTKVTNAFIESPSAHSPGPHCFEQYCPHRMQCSALAKGYNSDPVAQPNEHNIQQLIPAYKILGERAKKMKESVEGYIRKQGSVRFGNNWYGETFNSKGTSSGFKVLREKP